jgi:hypothetical protein
MANGSFETTRGGKLVGKPSEDTSEKVLRAIRIGITKNSLAAKSLENCTRTHAEIAIMG